LLVDAAAIVGSVGGADRGPKIVTIAGGRSFDMTLQFAMLAFGAPSVRMPCAPLLARASRQSGVGVGAWMAMAELANAFPNAPFS